MGICRLSAAMIWHHKHVASSYTELTGLSETSSNVEVCSVIWLCMWRVSHCRKLITSRWECTQHVMSRNHVWIRCGDFSNGTTWWPAANWIPTHALYRYKCVSFRCHYHIKETYEAIWHYPAWHFTGYSKTNWITEVCVHAGCQRNLQSHGFMEQSPSWDTDWSSASHNTVIPRLTSHPANEFFG